MTKMKTLTVAQLIELLQDQDPDMPVVFSTCYGDYSRTEQALPLKGEVDTVTIEKSAYSNSGFAISEPDEMGDGPDADGYMPTDSERAGYVPYLVIR